MMHMKKILSLLTLALYLGTALPGFACTTTIVGKTCIGRRVGHGLSLR